jgi:DNA-binding GntR family transcriptional regulator
VPQNQPMYRHIADDLREQIKDGRLKPKEGSGIRS